MGVSGFGEASRSQRLQVRLSAARSVKRRFRNNSKAQSRNLFNPTMILFKLYTCASPISCCKRFQRFFLPHPLPSLAERTEHHVANRRATPPGAKVKIRGAAEEYLSESQEQAKLVREALRVFRRGAFPLRMARSGTPCPLEDRVVGVWKKWKLGWREGLWRSVEVCGMWRMQDDEMGAREGTVGEWVPRLLKSGHVDQIRWIIDISSHCCCLKDLWMQNAQMFTVKKLQSNVSLTRLLVGHLSPLFTPF